MFSTSCLSLTVPLFSFFFLNGEYMLTPVFQIEVGVKKSHVSTRQGGEILTLYILPFTRKLGNVGTRLFKMAALPRWRRRPSLPQVWVSASSSSCPVFLAIAEARFFTCALAMPCHPPSTLVPIWAGFQLFAKNCPGPKKGTIILRTTASDILYLFSHQYYAVNGLQMFF